MALFWVRIICKPNHGQAHFYLCVQVLHPRPRGVAEVIRALHNVEEGHHQESGGEGRPQERGKGGRAVLALHRRGTGDEEAPQLLHDSEDEALMLDGNRRVQSTSERMTLLLLPLHPSN